MRQGKVDRPVGSLLVPPFDLLVYPGVVARLRTREHHQRAGASLISPDDCFDGDGCLLASLAGENEVSSVDTKLQLSQIVLWNIVALVESLDRRLDRPQQISVRIRRVGSERVIHKARLSFACHGLFDNRCGQAGIPRQSISASAAFRLKTIPCLSRALRA